MNNKKKLIFIIIFFICVLVVSIWKGIISKQPSTNNSNTNNNNTIENNNDITIPTSGNDTVIETKSNTSLRFINEYNTDFFTADKNLLIMFGSWCSHCAEELEDIEKIVNYYKDNKNVNIILIAHEYEDTISNLVSIVEQDFDFGNTEVFIDLKRIIRKTIDPDASTVPISYVVDKTGNVLKKHDNAITLDIAKDILK